MWTKIILILALLMAGCRAMAYFMPSPEARKEFAEDPDNPKVAWGEFRRDIKAIRADLECRRAVLADTAADTEAKAKAEIHWYDYTAYFWAALGALGLAGGALGVKSLKSKGLPAEAVIKALAEKEFDFDAIKKGISDAKEKEDGHA